MSDVPKKEPAEIDRSEASLLKSLVERNPRVTAMRLRKLGWRVLPPEKNPTEQVLSVVVSPR